MKKKKVIKTKKSKESEFAKNFVDFGNKKSVFKGITFATVFLSIIALPLIVTNTKILNYFILVWLLELVYIAFYLNTKKK